MKDANNSFTIVEFSALELIIPENVFQTLLPVMDNGKESMMKLQNILSTLLLIMYLS